MRVQPHVRRLLLAAPLVGAALAAPLSAQPITIGAYCTPGPVPQTWGDVAGRVNVSNRVTAGFGDGSVRTINLTGNGPGFGNLPCAVYGGDGQNPSWVGEVGLIPDGTSNTLLIGEVTFGLRAGAGTRNATLRIYNDDYSSLLASRTVTLTDGTSNTILLGERVTGPVRLQWNDPWFAGLGSITISAVPEPSTVALTALGLAALAAGAARRRRGIGSR